jgi:hypothetical protein
MDSTVSYVVAEGLRLSGYHYGFITATYSNAWAITVVRAFKNHEIKG